MDDSTRRPRSGRMVGRVLGIPIYLNASMFLLAALVTFVYGGFVRTQLCLPTPASYLVGFCFVV